MEAPQIYPGLEFYYSAFLDLLGDRNGGMSEGQITWTAINEFARRYEIEGDDFEDFKLIIRGIDAEYLAFKQKRRESESKMAERKSGTKEHRTIGSRPKRR